MVTRILARLSVDRRKAERRNRIDEPVLPTLSVFDRNERAALKALEKRRTLRRKADVRKRMAAL